MAFENEIKITNQYYCNDDKVYNVDKNDYMDNGGGRFALGSQFSIIQKFYENSNIQAGEYSKKDMAGLLGLSDSYGYNMQQRKFRDGKADYWERT